ncbi:MAG: hypothetical protein DMF87_16390 [Acidobacteria bacterium]|nr:MAG: hypothetical protein DMF87_16390 [Acidobacteriota bacterium]
MSEKTRDSLKSKFSDGERPSGSDFGDLIDSYVSKQNDFDGDGNLQLTRGVRLGDSAATVAGGLRFNSNQLQVFTGGAWTNVSSTGGGGFQTGPTIPGQPAVARDSFVGIGSFPAAPQFKFEVQLAANDGPGNEVRFGNVVCGNGAGLTFQTSAVIAHQQQAAININNNFALRQVSTGELHLNAPTGQLISLRQGGLSVRLGISALGNVIVGGQSELAGAPAGSVLQVFGGAFKNDGTGTWSFTSDARTKDDVQDLDLGLAQLRQVRPVRYRYNGRAGTTAGRAGVGVIGQEIEAIVPETVQRISVADDPDLHDLRVFDPSALTYVLINAVKELAAKVEHLEKALAATTAPASSTSPAIA